MAAVLKDLGRKGVTAVLLEGGGKLLASAFAAGCVDEIAFFYRPAHTGWTGIGPSVRTAFSVVA